MKAIVTILLIILFSTQVSANSLFNSEYYQLNFISKNVENDKLLKISNIKYQSLKTIFKNILIQKDFEEILIHLDEDLINTFIKNIVINEEKIINNSYSSKIKINFDKKKIVKYLRKKKISYVEFLPKDILIIIVEKSNLVNTMFSYKNTHYNYLIELV